MDYLPSEGDSAGQEKIKIKVYYEMICIVTKITMIAKYLEDMTTLVHSQLTGFQKPIRFTELTYYE